ncbi:MAG: DUF503 domain-containing protein [Agarilytica sp.]
MFIAQLQIRFFLHGCSSLKEKRGRLSGLRDKFGAVKNMAVCESDDMDTWQQASWSFVCTSTDKRLIESTLNKVLDHCAHNIDAEVSDQCLEWL